MANVITKPRHPIQNWEAMLQEWLAEVDSVIRQASAWAQNQGWGTKKDDKTISEEAIGTYVVPRLLIHTSEARLLLDPIARFIVGDHGRIDFCVMPSYDSVLLLKTDQGWKFHSLTRDDLDLDWSEESFVSVCRVLVTMQ
jgi:hypothetical protein